MSRRRENEPFFKTAQPIWPEDQERERNYTVGLYALVKTDESFITVTVTTAGFYRLFVDGQFTALGPTRCAHGYYRVDSLTIPLSPGKHHIAFEAVNYYLNSFASLRQPGFLQVEVRDSNHVLAATSPDTVAYCLTERVRKMQRFSYQRPMGESYRLTEDVYGWRVGNPGSNAVPVSLCVTKEKTLLDRGLLPYTYPVTRADRCLTRGTELFNVEPEAYKKSRSLTSVGNPDVGDMDGWSEEELELHLSDEVQRVVPVGQTPIQTPYTGETNLFAGAFEILSFNVEKTGYISAEITCTHPGTLYIMVAETLRPNGDVDPLSMDCLNVIKLDMEAGTWTFQSVEPYGFRYMKLLCADGQIQINTVRVVESVCPQPITAVYTGDSDKRKAVFNAACETFRQNCVDIFMDCPTRERAGWLCDSFFTARTERALTGDNAVERNFLENYRLPKRFAFLPDGMLPMCYPSDCLAGQYIPNWAMWFVLELEDYVKRSGDAEFIRPFWERVQALLHWFEQYENKDGLLEHLPGWVFVEWSRANQLVDDINFPTNMLYFRMLHAAANLFNLPHLRKKATRLRKVIRARSLHGTFFVDNEVYQNGMPISSGESTETCQYYAFFTGVATPETDPETWRILCEEFGPARQKKGL